MAQHLVLSILLTLGFVAQAQEATTTEARPPESQPSADPAPAAAPVPTATAPSAETSTKEAQVQEQEEIPAPQKSLLKSVATREFNKGLYFDQVDNGVILPPLELDYDLSQFNGKQLRIGNVLLNEKNFLFALLPLGKTHSQLNQVLGSGEAGKLVLVMSWPEKLLSHGTIEMISRTGNVVWTYSFDEDAKKDWQKKLDGWRKELIAKGVPAKDLARSGIFGSQFAILDLEGANAPFQNQKESFRFCVTQTDGRNSTKMCSQRYGTRTTGNNTIMGKVRVDPTTPRVLVQNEEAALKNSVVVGAEMPTAFFAELASGESYEFVTLPNKLELMDISDTKKPSVLRIVGYDTRPVGRSIILNPDQYSSLTKLLGFEATIGDPRKFWAAVIRKEDPKIFLPGQGGGIFKQRFELSQVPRMQSRVYLHRNTPKGTYIDGIELEGRKQPSAQISSEQNAVQVDSRDPSRFTWEFKATERGQINRAYLDVNFAGKNYKSYYEIYKGFPREISGRFTGVQASGEFIIMGEVAYNQWFEDIFGWTNYWMSRQRWGVSAKFFQSFNKLKVDAAGNTAPLSVMTVDLKYRLTPGLWGRDESVGALLSYQSVTFDKLKAPMLGVGAFWARSMPKVFDDFFNLMPFMRYPKWVDMEFIYYASSMDSKVTLNAPMSLNFHGKVLWSDRYFGEAGFGMKRYGFTDSSLNQKAELNTFYGTVGLGINF